MSIIAQSASNTQPTVTIRQAGDGVWHWVKQFSDGRCDRWSRERFTWASDALGAAVSIARCNEMAMDLTPAAWQRLHSMIAYGAQAYRDGAPVTEMRNILHVEGWWQEAHAEAARQKAECKPWLDDAPMALTLEEAIRLQQQRNAERIAENAAILEAR